MSEGQRVERQGTRWLGEGAGGGKRRTVNHNEAGSRDDEEHHDEACVALAGFALGPGVVYDLLVASEQVSHHNVRHIRVWCWLKWVALTATRFSKANDRRPLEKYSFLRDRFLFTVGWGCQIRGEEGFEDRGLGTLTCNQFAKNEKSRNVV